LDFKVVDDCGNVPPHASLAVSFSSTDPAVQVFDAGNGQETATWVPRNLASLVTMTVTAQTLSPPLVGLANISGAVVTNPGIPIINAGGVVNAASFEPNETIAPGSMITIFGSNLAPAPTPAGSLPLPTTLNGVQAILGGQNLPLLFANNGQINAVVPFGLPVNAMQQLLVVSQDVAYSMPETVFIADVNPAVFTQNQSGKGAGVITVVRPDGTQFNATPATPASSGDALVIYCTGLGSVVPAIPAGSAAPSSPPTMTANPVGVSIGGQTAQVLFSGLAPGFAGLGQVNVRVPSGIAAASDVPVVLSVAGVASPPVTVAIK
jgi:uncharacterized protein (TIGR03437 family)